MLEAALVVYNVCIVISKRNCYKYIWWMVSSNIYYNITWQYTQKNNTKQQQNMVSGVGDLTFTGLVFSWFFH